MIIEFGEQAVKNTSGKMQINKDAYFIMDINFNDLIQYYDVENHSAKETAEHFNVSISKIMIELKKHNFHKDKNKHVANIKKTKRENFGDENYNNRISARETCLAKYGVDNPFKDTSKIKECYKKHLGADHPMKSKHICDKVVSKKDYKKESLKRKETIKNKYFDQKLFNSNKSKLAWNSNHDNILVKSHETKKKNNSFNTSSIEETTYKYLCSKFEISDILREYSDARYPYRCHFYIKSKDLFIELNMHWSHGNHLFNSNDTEDLKILAEWKKKAVHSEFYKNAIETWTIRDIEKYNCSLKNNLNYLSIYDINKLYEVI